MKGIFKRYKGYCGSCDKDIAENGKKCDYCGVRSEGVKIKKKTAMRDILREEDEGC